MFPVYCSYWWPWEYFVSKLNKILIWRNKKAQPNMIRLIEEKLIGWTKKKQTGKNYISCLRDSAVRQGTSWNPSNITALWQRGVQAEGSAIGQRPRGVLPNCNKKIQAANKRNSSSQCWNSKKFPWTHNRNFRLAFWTGGSMRKVEKGE